jgi:hypothetical protein
MNPKGPEYESRIRSQIAQSEGVALLILSGV